MDLDLMSIASKVLGGSSVSGIASSTKVSKKDVSAILTSALPALIQGAAKQSSGKQTQTGFIQALEQHAGNAGALTSFFKNVDLDDGAKIVSHLLGKSQNTTTKKISKELNIDAGDVAKVLAAAAPLLMSLLGKTATSNKKKDKEATTASIAKSLLSNVDVSSLLGGSILK